MGHEDGDWIYLTHDKVQWQAPMNTAMDVWVSSGYFFTLFHTEKICVYIRG